MCPVDVSVGLQPSTCGLLLFYLLTPVCCLSGHSCFALWTVCLWQIAKLCLFHSFNLTENPVFLLSDQSDLSSPVSLMCLTTEQYFYSARGFRACGCLELKELQRGRYVKAQNASTAIFPPFFLAILFCAQRKLVAYELNVSWQADSELA